MTMVSIVKIKNNDIYEAVEKTIEFSGSLDIPENANVVIKLNLCALKTPETGITSDPRVVKAFLVYLRERCNNANITLVESDATTARADLFFEWLGFSNLARKYDCKVKNLSNDEMMPVKLGRDGYCITKFKIPKTVAESDYFISLAKMKTCTLTKISCCLKNQFGCIPYWRKDVYHSHIDEVIAYVNKIMPPDFCLVDGVIAHEGTLGPSAGKPKYMGLLVGGKDPVAVDSTCAKIMGFNPHRIGHIQKAKKLGLGNDVTQVVGENIENVRSKFRFSSWESFLFNIFMGMRRQKVEWQ